MAKEDVSTLATRKILIAIARSCIGAHYLRGTSGEVPPKGSLVMTPHAKEMVQLEGQPKPLEWGNYFAAENNHRRCSGKHGLDEIINRTPKGDITNPAHVADPDSYKWKRVVKFEKINPVWGESCDGKMHFDCSGFVRWCLNQVIPQFMQDVPGYSIAHIKTMLEPVGGKGVLDPNELCAADVLIRKNNRHIGFAIGDGQRVVQAEWENSGVVETSLQKWDFHGRIPQKYWQNITSFDEYDE